MRTRPMLRLEDKLDGERALLDALEPRDEGRTVAVAIVAAAVVLALVGILPMPAGASNPAIETGASGSWVTLVRWMPEPVPPAAPAPRPSVATPVPARPEPISLEAFREPEPIPEPSTSAFHAAPIVREPEAPLGVPEPPPAPAETTLGAEPELPTIPPRIAPGGQVSPTYPVAARSLRLSGKVRVEAQIDAAGAVVSVRVLGTNRPGVGFEEAAAAAVQRWRFVPATRGGVPVPGSAVFDVEFKW